MADTTGSPQLSRKQRAFILISCCIAVVGGLGCATSMMIERNNPNAPGYYTSPVSKDTILALARPDAKLAKKIGANSIAFVGKKKTYLLVKGGAEIANIEAELDGDRLKLLTDGPSLYLKGRTIWGQVILEYRPRRMPAEDPSERTEWGTHEHEQLIGLGFERVEPSSYQVAIDVEGVVKRPMEIGKELQKSFKTTYPIYFYNPPTSNPPPDLSKIVLWPLAVVTDILLLPGYIGLTLLSMVPQ